MENLINKLQKILLPIATKINKNKFMSSLGKTFQILMPIIMLGSFAALGAFIDIKTWQDFIQSNGIADVFMGIQSVSLNLISIYLVITLGYLYGDALGTNGLSSSIISLLTFLLITPHEVYVSLPMEWFNYSGMFCAMLVSGLVPKFIHILIKNNIYIHMPDRVPDLIEKSFASILPAFLIAIIASLIAIGFKNTSFGNIHNFIYSLLQIPLQKLGLSFAGYLLIQILSTLLMFTGIHGNAIFSIITPLAMAAGAQNLEALQMGKELPNIITSSFQVFCQPGGIGGTLGLAFLLLFVSKSERFKQLGKLAVIPSIFGINEPIIFGMPVILNPLLIIPFIVNPLVCTSISYLSMLVGLVPYPTGVEINWTVPFGLSGFLAQGWQSVILQALLLILTTLIWLPFFKMVDNNALKEESLTKEKE